MKEGNLLNRILLAVSRLHMTTLFRNNTGQGWVGRSKSLPGGTVIIADARPLAAGLCKGSSDLIGWTRVEITPEMVGQKIAVFTAIEIKTPGSQPTTEQVNFIVTVQDAGGIAGVARSEADAINIVTQLVIRP